LVAFHGTEETLIFLSPADNNVMLVNEEEQKLKVKTMVLNNNEDTEVIT